MESPIAVLGAGNVGHAMAGHLASQGHRVHLYSRWEAELEPIRRLGGIQLEGEVTAQGRPAVLTTAIDHAIDGAVLIMVTAPAFAHRFLSTELSKCVATGQIVVFQPAVFGSSLEFMTILAESGRPRILTAETETSLYTCRLKEPGRVFIGAIKRSVDAAALPASATSQVLALLNRYFDGHYTAASNVLATGLANSNPVYHCPPSLLNFSAIDKGEDQPFHELVTPSVARVIDAVDAERLELGRTLGVELRSFRDFLNKAYGVRDGDLVELIHKAYGRQAFRAPNSPAHRYLTEDIPFGLVPWASTASQVAVRMPVIDALIDIANTLYGRDLRREGRSVDSLGLKGLSADQIRDKVTSAD
jgi:opine dehydrogenase